MKILYRFNTLILILFIAVFQLKGQVVITTDDMPDVGDTIRVSLADARGLADPSVTGYNFSWDYSTLEPNSQNVIQYVSPTSTPFLYQIAFNPMVSNLASPINNLDFFSGEVTDAYIFYKNTSSEYVCAGYAASVYNLPIPLKYGQPERLYKFPLSVSSVPDSSISEFVLDYPDMAYLSIHKKRVNSVDGYGSLITPFGTFNTLRIKSFIYEHDSIYLDSLQAGIPLYRNYIEYKWLSNEYPEPILTITQEGLLVNAQYIDSVRDVTPLTVSVGPDVTVCPGEEVTITASVDGGEPPYSYLWNNMEATPSITVTAEDSTSYYVLVTDSKNNFAMDSMDLNVLPLVPVTLGNDTLLCADHSLTFTILGIYDQVVWYVNDVQQATGQAFTIDSTGIGINEATVKVEYLQGNCPGSDEIKVTFHLCNAIQETPADRLILVPNPVGKTLTVQSTTSLKEPSITITSLTGNRKAFKIISSTSNKITIDVRDLVPGIYFITIGNKDTRISRKFVKM
ncbi:MAG: T9SS type A sorting domain-containing protein [Lentimicrobiaceae bacterium]